MITAHSNKAVICLIAVSAFCSIFSLGVHGGDIQEQSQEYRQKGLDAQKSGDYVTAMSFYRKSLELDPSNFTACNDLGVLYEGLGDVDSAEKAYIQAILIKKDYAKPYANLAMLYESKGDFKKALEYWEKRIQLGSSSDDTWTKNAQLRYYGLSLILKLRERGVKIKDSIIQDILK